MKKLELGITSFAELTDNTKSYEKRLLEIIDEIKLADKLGLDYFGIGEHHRKDYAASSPSTIIAAASMVTSNITLGSAVVVLSSEDPIRLIEQYRTIHALSNGRVELMVGRGSFIESFPLFGYDLDNYHLLFEEKLDLLHKLNHKDNVSWEGKTHHKLKNINLYPKINEPLNISIGVGGSRESVARAAKYGLPLVLAIIGGNPLAFKPFVQYYKHLYKEYGHPIEKMHISASFHGFITNNEEDLKYFKDATIKQMNQIGKERGWSNYNEARYEEAISYDGAMIVGNPISVAGKIKYLAKELELDRLMLQFTVGTIPTEITKNAITLLATDVRNLIDK